MKTALLQQNNSTDFGLISPYDSDVWHICEWDIYKNASEDYKKKWKARSNIMKNNMDFSLCKNETIREESKYFAFYLLTIKEVSLTTFAEYADRFKLFFAFVNNRQYQSILDIDTVDYERHIAINHKTIIDDGTVLNGQELVPSKRRNRLIAFLDFFKNIIYQYIESVKPIYERDVWNWKDVAPNETSAANLIFYDIEQPVMKESAKDFLKQKLSNCTMKTAYKYLDDIKIFCRWLYEYDDNIASFKEVTRDILEDYFLFLRVESDFSQNKININILNLSVMFEYGIVAGDNRFPDDILFLADDYCFKTVHRANFYTNEEIAAIFSMVEYLPKIYGRILLVLHHTGMRISEVLRLQIDCLRLKDNAPYLSVYMYKTKRYNNIPVDDYVYQIISREIKRTQKLFPDSEYVFVNSKGNAFTYSTFITTIKKCIVEHKVVGRDGKLLDFRTHRFRATKATYLINSGHDPRNAANMLGQSCLSSLSYYAVATNQSLSKHMQEYLIKESILINSIGQVDENIIEDYENAHPLCNGWCCKPIELGVCDKINACLTCSLFKPSIEHLTTYRLQLSEMESSLAVASENGFTRMAEQCEKEKAALENIIKGLEERLV